MIDVAPQCWMNMKRHYLFLFVEQLYSPYERAVYLKGKLSWSKVLPVLKFKCSFVECLSLLSFRTTLGPVNNIAGDHIGELLVLLN